ncbi:glutamyl-tRNAGlu reductase, N-terminal-like domain protein [Leptospira ryugenii]|uniref:Glutamyl-tRNAGlu reductase, N-terminal-like domain protein n=1 Tax=Leptospira ryugenii TaxID=1917863 RepID=A0A2P2DVL5_9LEPT|nr:hypothetical protein [Leptospira ryugenii]GBF48610.1 glutamyl-tRNAGlu reductase, N-terminal-like domain protein [Leptospira ryugenii]
MFPQLQILHDTKKQRSKEDVSESLLWTTCQRTLRFSWTADLKQWEGRLGVYASGEEAHALLLEIISGLHSQLFGEREVYYQFLDRFKDLRLQNEPNASMWIAFRKLIIEQFEFIKETYLKDLRANSYINLIRDLLPASGNIVIFGTGNLAESLLEDLDTNQYEIIVYGRSSSRLKHIDKKYQTRCHHLEEYTPISAFHIIASTEFSPTLLKEIVQTNTIVDFRENISNSQGEYKNYHTLEKRFEIANSLKYPEVKERITKDIRNYVKSIYQSKNLSYANN